MRLKRGRSKESYLLLALDHVHVFVWWPGMSRRCGPDSFGTTVRWRRGTSWQHVRLTLFQRNALRGSQLRSKNGGRAGQWAIRRTLTIFELSGWTTYNGTRERDGMKSYLRLKAGAGGRLLDRGGEPTANAR